MHSSKGFTISIFQKQSSSSKVRLTVQRIECVVRQDEKECLLERGPLNTQPKIVLQATGPHDFFIPLFERKQK